MDSIVEELRKDLFARRVSIPLRNDPEDLGEHRRAHAQIGAGVDQISLQLRRVLQTDPRRDLGKADPHDRTTDFLADDPDCFLGRFRFGNEDQPATGLHRDGKRIVRADRLDELFDDRRLQ